MRHVMRIALASLVLGAVLLSFCAMPFASAPKPPPPAGPAPPYVPTQTGHEGYPFAGDPPQGHEQGVIYNSFPTSQQQGLYNKFVGFYQDYRKA